jgi:hypothetical protein
VRAKKECVQKQIDGREFDICGDCWRPLEETLKGKGRVRKAQEIVVLPPPIVPEPMEPKPPGLPPKIFCRAKMSELISETVSRE